MGTCFAVLQESATSASPKSHNCASIVFLQVSSVLIPTTVSQHATAISINHLSRQPLVDHVDGIYMRA